METLLDEDNPYAAYLKEHSHFYDEGTFRGRLYNIGNYPGAVLHDHSDSHVHGSIFSIDEPETVLKELDDYEGFGNDFAQPNEFIRELVEVETENKALKCWVYLYNLPVNFLRHIISGDYLKAGDDQDMEKQPASIEFSFPGHTTISADGPPVEFDISDFLYEAIDVSKYANIKDWGQYFDGIPVDPYIKDGYRFKSIAWFRIKHDMVAPNN